MCGRLIAWGSLGAMPDAIFDTDYRVDIIQLNIQTNMEENYISCSSLNESVCLYACKVEPIVLYIYSPNSVSVCAYICHQNICFS